MRLGKEISTTGFKSKTVVTKPQDTANYLTITDFDPTEDVIVIPLALDGKPNVFISKDTTTENDLAFKYASDARGTNIFATLNFDSKFNSADKKALENSVLQSALLVDKNGISVGLDQGNGQNSINSYLTDKTKRELASLNSNRLGHLRHA